MTASHPRRDGRSLGWISSLVVLALYGGMALTADVKSAGIYSDGATYYLSAYSLAFDGDVEYRQEDLARAYREYPSGPAGIFLKRGTDVTTVALSSQPPFIEFRGVPDPDATRLYYGKSFIYPLFAAPFVRLLGTNGFLVLNALLLWAAFYATFAFARVLAGSHAAVLWAGGFTFASVVPVYAVWTQPELFNWALGVVAMVLWLYKYVSPTPTSRRTAWARAGWTDLGAAALIGILTFSKITNILLLPPMLAWQLWTRQWRQAVLTGATAALVAAAAFGANVASSGEWNYQGGDRATCYGLYPFQAPGVGLDVCPERARSDALGSVIFDREVFWSNLRANLAYFIVGRNSGLLPYYAPLVLAALGLIWRWRRVPSWQWCVLGGIVVHSLVFIISMPYTYAGSGGSVGNRYFMGVYGAAAVLVPVAWSSRWFVAPWILGSLFVAKLVITPFQTSMQPGQHAKSGPFRLLPPELTNINDWPLNTQLDRVRIWFGDSGAGDPGFQIYYLDDNAYGLELTEVGKSFWVRGESHAQLVIKGVAEHRTLQVHLAAGPVPTTASVHLNGRTSTVALTPGGSTRLRLALGRGFPYKMDRLEPAYIWRLEVSSSAGFAPAAIDGAADKRYLGVRVTPTIVE